MAHKKQARNIVAGGQLDLFGGGPPISVGVIPPPPAHKDVHDAAIPAPLPLIILQPSGKVPL